MFSREKNGWIDFLCFPSLFYCIPFSKVWWPSMETYKMMLHWCNSLEALRSFDGNQEEFNMCGWIFCQDSGNKFAKLIKKMAIRTKLQGRERNMLILKLGLHHLEQYSSLRVFRLWLSDQFFEFWLNFGVKNYNR